MRRLKTVITRIAVTTEREQRPSPKGPNITTTHTLLSMAALLAGMISFFAAGWEGFDNFRTFWVLAVTVLAYSVAQSWLVYRKERWMIYLNPTIHTALIGNFLLFVVGGSVFILPPEFGGFQGKVTSWMVLWMLLYLSGSVALWTGYWSGLAMGLSRTLRRSPLLHRVIRREFRVNSVLLWMFFGIGVASLLVQITLGIFGYSRDSVAALASVGIQQYLGLGSALVPFTLLVLALQFFSGGSGGRKPVVMLVIVLVFSVFSGFLSGFKSQVVMPILIVGLAYYVVHQRLAKWVLPIGLVLLFSAYSVIEPFRLARNDDSNFQSQSFFYIYESMFSPNDPYREHHAIDSAGKIAHFVNAQFVIPIWSEGLRYFSENEGLPEGSPDFLRNILIAPLLAVVPRVVWPDKPQSLEGNWFYVKVLGHSGSTSVSISGVTSLYFAGGWFAVLTGFFFLGVLQRALFRGLLAYGAGGLLIFLGMFSGLRGFNLYHALLVDLIRTIPMLIVLQYFLLRPVKKY